MDVSITENNANAGDTEDGGDQQYSAPDADDGSDASVDAPALVDCPDEVMAPFLRCRGRYERPSAAAPGEPQGPAPLPASLSSSDLASISPQGASLEMEPNGWALIGQPTNFWTTAVSHSVQAVVLGHSVTITFEPASTTYDYGDGTTNTVETPGASWQELGLPQLSDTNTSHRYESKTSFTVTATINYRATVSVGGRTIPVSGTVSGIGGSASFRVYELDTHLVYVE